MNLTPGGLRGNRALLAPTRRLLRGVGPRFAVLVIISMIVGLGQATVLTIVVRVALHLADSTLADAGSGGLLDHLPAQPSALIGIGFAAIGCVFVLETLNAYLQSMTGARVVHLLRTGLYRAYSNAEIHAQDSLRSGQLAQLLTVNGAYAGTATLSAAAAAVALSTFATLGLVAAVLSPGPTLAMVVGVTLVFFLVRPIVGGSRGASKDMADRNTDLTETTGLAVELSDIIRTTGVEAEYATSVNAAISDMSAYWGRVRFLGRVGPAVFRNVALLLTFGAIAAVYAMDIDSIATLGATMLILIRSLTYMQAFQNSLQELHSTIPWLEDMWATSETLESHPIDRSGVPLESFGPIDFTDAGLVYPNGTAALRAVNARLEPGEIIGLIGPSGAGKSSFAHLLLRLRKPTTGAVRVNDQDLAEVELDDWFSRVAYVPQEPRLLPSTIADNIAFFRDTDREAIEGAAVAAGIHHEILDLPDGYDTSLNADTRLSGGQRQRLALARALVTRPQLLVLDEPTSALDMQTEARVAEAISALRGETTVMIIAHRLSSLVHCDRLIVIEDGTVTANACPDELREDSEFYREAIQLSIGEVR